MSDAAYHKMDDDAPNRPTRNAANPPASTPADDGKDGGDAGMPVAQPVSQGTHPGVSREAKRSPNRLIVDEAHGEGDNSVVMLSLAKMEGQTAARSACVL